MIKKKRIRCVMVPPMNSSSYLISYSIRTGEIDNPKWISHRVTITTVRTYSDSNLQTSTSRFYTMLTRNEIVFDLNKIASKVSQSEVYGPAIFILLDDEFIPTDLSVSSFKSKHLK